MFFYNGVVEPAATARFQGWDKDPAKPTSFGKWEDIEALISSQLEKSPYMLGDEFSATDIIYGSVVQFFKGNLFPHRPHYNAYLERLSARPAYQRAQARDIG